YITGTEPKARFFPFWQAPPVYYQTRVFYPPRQPATHVLMGSLFRLLICDSSRSNPAISVNRRYTLANRTYATSFSTLNRSITISPILAEDTSGSPHAYKHCSISDTSASSCKLVTDVFSHALYSPPSSLSRLNNWRVPSCLITMSCGRSSRSYVVKRYPQSGHARLRRIAWPSPASRDSITFVSSHPHWLHF